MEEEIMPLEDVYKRQLVQRAIEEAGIPTIIIAALPPVVRQTGTPRAVAPVSYTHLWRQRQMYVQRTRP